MNAHRSLTRADIVRRSPSDIALMVASEFSRASSRCGHRDNVLNCYARAQELLGIMETMPLSEEAAASFEPLYRQCTSRELVTEFHMTPMEIERIGTKLAEAFQVFAGTLSERHPSA